MAELTNCYYAEPVGWNHCNKEVKKILLPPNQPVWLGRRSEGDKKDLELAEQQLYLKANYEMDIIECVSHGINPSGCNGCALMRGAVYNLVVGDRVEIVLGKYMYKIVFRAVNMSEMKYYDKPEQSKKILKEINEKSKLYDKKAVQEVTLPKTSNKGWEFIDCSLLIYTPDVSLVTLPKTSNIGWEFIDGSLLIYTPDVSLKGDHIASFNLDETLITTKSDNESPKDGYDWKLKFPFISENFKTLHSKNFRIVIFSNQPQLSQKKELISGFKKKIQAVIKEIGVPIQVFVATKKDIYWMPAPGMWNKLLERTNENICVDHMSFHVGRAVGIQEVFPLYTDIYGDTDIVYTCEDALFAKNIGLQFFTPMNYFLNDDSATFRLPDYNPASMSTSLVHHCIISPSLEVIFMIGYPGSGKTHYCRNHLIPLDYCHINRREKNSIKECCEELEARLKEKKSVVIDDRNLTVSSRKPYIMICKRYHVPYKCIFMKYSPKCCQHNIRFRSLIDKTETNVTDADLEILKIKIEKPCKSEGYELIIEIEDVTSEFNTEKEEKLYKMYLLES